MRTRLMVGGAIAPSSGSRSALAAPPGRSRAAATSILPSSSCGPVFYKGSGSPQYLIATDLPLQGAGRAQLLAMQQAVQFVLEKQYKFKAGKYTIGYQGCDDSTAQTGAWDPGEVLVERARVRSGEDASGRPRDVQLRLREAHRPDPQPGSGRSGRDGQLGEHERGSDPLRAVEQSR